MGALAFRSPSVVRDTVSTVTRRSTISPYSLLRVQAGKNDRETRVFDDSISSLGELSPPTPQLPGLDLIPSSSVIALNVPMMNMIRNNLAAPLHAVLGPAAASEFVDRTLMACSDANVQQHVSPYFDGFSLPLQDHAAQIQHAFEASGPAGVEQAAQSSFQQILRIPDAHTASGGNAGFIPSESPTINLPLISTFVVVVFTVGFSLAATGVLSAAATYVSTGLAHAARAFSLLKSSASPMPSSH